MNLNMNSNNNRSYSLVPGMRCACIDGQVDGVEMQSCIGASTNKQSGEFAEVDGDIDVEVVVKLVPQGATRQYYLNMNEKSDWRNGENIKICDETPKHVTSVVC